MKKYKISLSIIILYVIVVLNINNLFAQESYIATKGTASLEIPIDMFIMNLNYYRFNGSADSTMIITVTDEIIPKMNKIFSKYGIPDSSVRTTNFSIDTNTEYNKKQSEKYKLSLRMVLYLQKTDFAEELTFDLTKIGIHEIYYQEGICTKQSYYENELLKLAIKDAKRRAEIAAKASDVEISGVFKILDNDVDYEKYELDYTDYGSKKYETFIPVRGVSSGVIGDKINFFASKRKTISKSIDIVFLLKNKI